MLKLLLHEARRSLVQRKAIGQCLPVRYLSAAVLTIDLRSDTVTQPTAAMRQAMANAEVGDDVYGDDPTVNKLESTMAAMSGKEAALFVPSGSMGNLIAVMVHCWDRGSEFIVGKNSHIFLNEQGSAASIGGVHPFPVTTQQDGTFDLNEVKAAIRISDPHFPATKLICVEDTHNEFGGVPLPQRFIDDIGALTREHGLKLHLDGARLWHSLAATGLSAQQRLQHVDTAMICLSKGLGAPVGSVIVGDDAFIHRGRRLRKALGGGMRQAGVLAAAGLYALEHHRPRILENHAHALRLAEGLSGIPGLLVDADTVRTNMVYFDFCNCSVDAFELETALADRGIRAVAWHATRMRMVTHLHVTDQCIERVIQAVDDIVRQTAR